GGRAGGIGRERARELILGLVAHRRRRIRRRQHADRRRRRRLLVGDAARDLDQQLAARRRVGILGERGGEQRVGALVAELAHRGERDPPQLGILRGQRLDQRVLVDAVLALGGGAGDRDRGLLHRRPRRVERLLDDRDLGRGGARDRRQPDQQIGELVGLLGVPAQRLDRAIVAGRVGGEPGQ